MSHNIFHHEKAKIMNPKIFHHTRTEIMDPMVKNLKQPLTNIAITYSLTDRKNTVSNVVSSTTRSIIVSLFIFIGTKINPYDE